MKLLRRLSYIVLFMSLINCGGGSLSNNTGGSGNVVATDPFVISLSLSDQNATGQTPITVSASVTQGNKAVVSTVVTFTTSLGDFSPASGTALTDANGVATITLKAGNVRGAGTLTAKLATGESSDISFSTQGDDIGTVGDINISVTLVDSNGNPTETITSSKPGRVIATINGVSTPLIVTFTSSVGDIPIATAITNGSNQATVDILAGGSLGAGTVTASIATGESGKALFVVGSSTVTMGSGTPFTEGVADISLTQISAGGTTVVSVSVVDDQGALFAEPVAVNFSSRCTSSNPATATLSSPVTTSNGVATSTYLAKGCVGDDQINVTANAGGINLSATGVVNVLAADVGSIEFVSASPTHISIQGVGSLERPESSTIIFRVLDTNGNPVNNREVKFSLNTNAGQVQVIPASAFTNSEGIVQTVVNSGTVAKTIRVTANIKDSIPLLLTQSSELIISTGIPDQDSFSVSAEILNPEAWDLDGTEVLITARLADAFNNPPPPTVVFFTTEGGSIGNVDKQCTSGDDGSCSVTWRSQSPRPIGHVLGDVNNVLHLPEVKNTMGQRFGGRTTILATTIGEESFPDLNGNGRFDLCEVLAFTGGVGKPCNDDGTIDVNGADITYSGNDVSGRPYDLREAFSDYNEDDFFNPNPVKVDPNNCGANQNQSCIELGGELEEPADFNNDGTFNDKDGKYNGVLCTDANVANCSTERSLDVRGQVVLVMSGSTARFCTNATPDNAGSTMSLIKVLNNDAVATARTFGLCNSDTMVVKQDDDNDPNTPDVDVVVLANSIDNTVYIKGENSSGASVIISDLHNQPMPAGTTVTFTATAGSVVGPSTFAWPNDNHNGGLSFGVTIKGEKEPKSGSLIVEVETPGGLSTIYSRIGIVIQ